jgi:Zn-dependent M28 family amino/carboxypeptidase
VIVMVVCTQSHRESLTTAKDGKHILEVLGAVEEKNLRSVVSHLEKYGNRSTPAKQWEAASWVAGEFEKLGLEVSFHQYEFDGTTWRNVTGTIKGNKRPQEVVMLITHIDSISHGPPELAPGADDNAGGVAVLLETARLIRGMPLDRTVSFGVFTNEEKGAAGSKAYARQMKDNLMGLKAVVNLDILGYGRPKWPFYLNAITGPNPLKQKMRTIAKMGWNYFLGLLNGRNVIKVTGKGPNQKLVETTSKLLREASGLKAKEVIGEDCGWGDEDSFQREGFNAISIISFYRNPYRHSPNDRLEYIDFEQLQEISKGVLLALIHLAKNTEGFN